jgi:hypothetical protein
MAAIKVRVTELCFHESELKNVGSEFWLTDIKNEDGEVLITAEKQFTPRYMVRCDAAVKGKRELTPAQAQAKADEVSRQNFEAKELTRENAVKVVDPPAEAGSPI